MNTRTIVTLEINNIELDFRVIGEVVPTQIDIDSSGYMVDDFRLYYYQYDDLEMSDESYKKLSEEDIKYIEQELVDSSLSNR